MRYFLATAATACALMLSGAPAQACVDVQARQAGQLVYDPTSAFPLRERILVTLRASEGCGQDADDGIGVIAIGFTKRLGTTLVLEVIEKGLNVLSSDDRFDRSVSYDFTGQKTAVVEFDLIVARGQRIRDKKVELDLVYSLADPACANAACRAAPREERVPVVFNVEMMSIARIALSGGRRNGVLDFGTLTTNEQKQIAVDVTSTTPFKVTFDSEHDGKMLLNGGDPSKAEETVPYALTLNGQPVSDDVDYEDSSATGTGGQALALMLVATILDASAKRAGEYRDVVTIRIEPSLGGGGSPGS